MENNKKSTIGTLQEGALRALPIVGKALLELAFAGAMAGITFVAAKTARSNTESMINHIGQIGRIGVTTIDDLKEDK